MIKNSSSSCTSWELDYNTLKKGQELSNYIFCWKNDEPCHSQEEYDANSVKSKGRFCFNFPRVVTFLSPGSLKKYFL